MPRLACILVALALLATTASAQAPLPVSPDLGPSLGYGASGPEAVALGQQDDFWSAQYRFGSGLAIGALASVSSFSSFTPLTGPPDGVLGLNVDGIRQRAGVTAERVLRTGVADLRFGGLAVYGYDRRTRVGYTLQEGGTYPGQPVPDSFRTLRPDGRHVDEATSSTLTLASSLTARRAVRLSPAGRLDPGIGVAVTATQTVSGRSPNEIATATAFLRLPARLALTDRIGITLDATIGAQAAQRNDVLVSLTGVRWVFRPATGAALRMDF